MAATGDLDTATAVLAAAREHTATAQAAEAGRFQMAVDWAAMHSADSLGAAAWEGELPIAGEGAPLVAEFCVAEFALAIGMSTDAGRRYLGDAIETRYRLPRVWALVVAEALPVWRARKIAQATLPLPPEGAAFVDQHVAPCAATVSLAQLDRVVEEARVRFDPAEAEARRASAAESRHFDIHTQDVSVDGTVPVQGTLDLADALDLEDAIAAGAQALANLGCPESLDVRRSLAAGQLARHQPTLGLDTGTGTDTGTQRPKPRQVVLHVHTRAGDGFAFVENTRSLVSVDQVRDWCGNPDAQVVLKPVADLNALLHTDRYAPTPALREQTVLTHPTCVFPRCTRPSRRCDLDHVIPFPDGVTDSTDLAPLCRGHHRLKTHGGWRYRRTGPTSFLWTSPHGHQYRRDS
jgi:hypothetical protein